MCACILRPQKDLAHIWEVGGSQEFADEVAQGGDIFLNFKQVGGAVAAVGGASQCCCCACILVALQVQRLSTTWRGFLCIQGSDEIASWVHVASVHMACAGDHGGGGHRGGPVGPRLSAAHAAGLAGGEAGVPAEEGREGPGPWGGPQNVRDGHPAGEEGRKVQRLMGSGA